MDSRVNFFVHFAFLLQFIVEKDGKKKFSSYDAAKGPTIKKKNKQTQRTSSPF